MNLDLKKIAVGVVVLTGLIVLADYFFKISLLQSTSIELQRWSAIVSAFMVGTALINMLKGHGGKIFKRSEGWQFSAVLVIMLFTMLIVGLLDWFKVQALPGSFIFGFLFDSILTPSGTAMTSLLAFFIVTAAYRSMRIRNIDSMVFLAVAVLLMMMNAPIFQVIWPSTLSIGEWIIEVPQATGMRGILIGVAIGTIATGVRILIGLEKFYLGRKE